MEGSYQFEKLEGRFVEAARLTERAQLRMEGFPALLRGHGFPPAGKVLELGCGQGIRTRKMAELFPEARIIGIDRSTELMDVGTEGNIEFRQANLYELPFEDASFDFAYSRLVFMHLTEPKRALEEIRRVLRPGGRVLIEDADRDCMFFEPAPASFPWFWDAVQEGQRRLGGDPNVGRKLASYFNELGFTKLNVEVQPIVGAGPEIDFLVRTLLPSLNTYLPTEDRPRGESAIADLGALARDPRAAFYHMWFAVSAEA